LDQRFEEPFEGELSFMLRGLVADAPGDVLINLPEVRPLIRVETEAPSPAPSAVCDTLIVRADRMQIHLVFRCAMPWSPKTGDRGTVVLRDPAAEERIKREQAEAMP
jgi:hypothetical protein